MHIKTLVRLAAATTMVVSGLLVGSQFVRSDGGNQANATLAPCFPYEVLLAHADGSVTGEAPSGSACPGQVAIGSLFGQHLNAPIVGIAATPDGGGYWLVASDGGIFTYGNAQFYGSTGALRLNAPIVGMASTPDGHGYWLTAADGGVFTFGDAKYYGSMGAIRLNKPVVGIAADAVTGGYWLVASDGGVFTFDAPFLGSEGGQRLNAPIRFLTGTPDFGGYRMVGADGGVFNFGDAKYYGSAANQGSNAWGALAASPDGAGYWLFANSGTGFGVRVAPFGDASPSLSGSGGQLSASPIVGGATVFQLVAPVVTTNPNDEIVPLGGVATFTAAASGYPTPTVQWQTSVNQGTTFANLANAASTTLSFPTIEAETGLLIRAVFTNPGGSVSTTAATLTVGGAPDVTTQPANQTVNEGQSATFTALATGTPTPTVQWEVSTNGGGSFASIPGASSTSYTLVTTAAESGNEYRAIFENTIDNVFSNAATLTVIPSGYDIPSSVGGYLTDVSCATSQDCIAVGQTQSGTALIERSLNGGATFVGIPVPMSASPLVSVDCNDATHCVAIGSDAAMVSLNGGASWILEASPAPDKMYVTHELDGVACASDLDCTAVGRLILGGSGLSFIVDNLFIFSTDGGQTWTNSTAPPNILASTVTCGPVTCLADGEGPLRSTDHGATWAIDANSGGQQLDISCSSDRSTCMAVGPNITRGTVAVTGDEGVTWTLVSGNLPPSVNTLQAVSCGASKMCMAVGPSPSLTAPLVVVTTADAGATWTSHTGPVGITKPQPDSNLEGFPSLDCSNATSCVVVGTGDAGPLAFTTTDGGATWIASSVQ